jgi:hypothetical protein
MAMKRLTGQFLDLLGDYLAHAAGWLFCRAEALNPDPPLPVDEDAVGRIFASCTAYQPSRVQQHAAYLAEKHGQPIFLVPPRMTGLPSAKFVLVYETPQEQAQRRPS